MLIAGVTANRRIRTHGRPNALLHRVFARIPIAPGLSVGRARITKILGSSEPGLDRIVCGDKLPLRQSQSAISRRRLLQQQDWSDVCKSESVVGTNIHPDGVRTVSK